jgi:glycosyltransferase involved in cell wall biosynthesis
VTVRQDPSPHPPHRFVFVGSDRQIQNRLSIDWLVNFWREARPGAELHIFGAQARPAEEVPGVHWRGFVEQAWEIYHPGSIALAPTLVGGGIKTKVLEAWGYGCPVLGTPMAFEDLPIDGYPLVRPLDQWAALLTPPPGEHTQIWDEAARIGHAFVAQALTPAGYALSWRRLIAPA